MRYQFILCSTQPNALMIDIDKEIPAGAITVGANIETTTTGHLHGHSQFLRDLCRINGVKVVSTKRHSVRVVRTSEWLDWEKIQLAVLYFLNLYIDPDGILEEAAPVKTIANNRIRRHLCYAFPINLDTCN